MPLSKARDRERKRVARLEKRYDGHCADCGYDEVPAILLAHHNDGDRNNDKTENKVKLCPNCHAKRHSPNGVVSFGLSPIQPVSNLSEQKVVQPNAKTPVRSYSKEAQLRR